MQQGMALHEETLSSYVALTTLIGEGQKIVPAGVQRTDTWGRYGLNA